MAKKHEISAVLPVLTALAVGAPRWTRTLPDGRTVVLWERDAHQTREAWLDGLTDRLRPAFAVAARPLPVKIRTSCGWPAGSRGGRKAIGQAWSASSSADQAHETFVSPALDECMAVAAVMVHELCHHAVGTAAGHGPAFGQLAHAMGLTGKLTATHASPELADALAPVLDLLGPYPHGRLSGAGRRKQSTRMLKLSCSACGYQVRTTAKWVSVGLPVCPCGEELSPEGGDGGEDE